MAKTDNFELCQQYVKTYLENIKKQLDQCELELRNQLQLCPIKILSIDHMNHCLQEYVTSQRKYLLMRNKQQLIQFKNNIQQTDLSIQNIPISLTLNHNQVNIGIYFYKLDNLCFIYVF